MVTLITGDVGAGKTTRLLAFHRAMPAGTSAGVASVRVPDGYELSDLASSARRLLAVVPDGTGSPFRRTLVFDRFVFDADAFEWAEDILDRALADARIRHLFLDEVGPLELQGFGFHDLFRRLLAEEARGTKDVVAVVRTECLERVVRIFGIGAPGILPVSRSDR
jgi:nucleoside-triphosphatase THEP1